jgi:hypothetical protein
MFLFCSRQDQIWPEATMDNKINEIRRKIGFLRSEMLDLEDAIRAQVNREEDCSVTGRRLMDMRRQMVALVRQRDALGGRERMLTVEERLKADYRSANLTPIKGAQIRRG